MVINRLGYDNASTIGLINKHGFMKLSRPAGLYGGAYLPPMEIGYEGSVDLSESRDRLRPLADAVTRPR